MILDHILLTHGTLQAQRSICLELTDNGNDLLLGGVNLLDLDRPERIHVLAEHIGSIKILHTLRPLGVAMAGKEIYDPYKD